MSGPPPDPRAGRFTVVARALDLALLLCAVASAVAEVAGHGPTARAAGAALVVLLVGAPVLRVLWLVARWFRRGDPRYALVGLGVLAVMVAGTLLAR